MGSGQQCLFINTSSKRFLPLHHIILLIFPPAPHQRVPLPSWTGGLSKCVLTAEVTLSVRPDLGAVCLHLAAYLQMPGKRAKVIFCVWPAGKSEANDPGRVDCYLAPGIALHF